MKFNKKKILVTGADGFIGSHLAEELICRNYNVKAFVHYNSFNSWGWLDHSPPEIKKSLEIFSGDIRDPHAMTEALKDCDIVFHLAALIGIPYSYHSPDSYIDTNIKGTLNIVQAARKLEIEKIVHTSTSEVYGSAIFVPITEEHPLQGQSPYSASKIGADQVAMSFYSSFNTPVTIIRPFNTYGPKQSARAIIPAVIIQIARGKKKIKLGSLHPTRDFSYIKDIVQAFIAVGKSDRSIGEVLNAGSNFEISIKDTAEIIAKSMHADIEIITDNKRIRPKKSEVNRLWADNKKIRKLTGWKPEYVGKEGFKRGISETVKWFIKSNKTKLYKADIYNL